MLSVSTAPRITLEFGKCKREDWLEWNAKGVRFEIAACEKRGGEAEAVIVVDQGDEGKPGKGKIAGFAVWGWNVSVTFIIKFLLPYIKFES
jgi:hypothetical protein